MESGRMAEKEEQDGRRKKGRKEKLTLHTRMLQLPTPRQLLRVRLRLAREPGVPREPGDALLRAGVVVRVQRGALFVGDVAHLVS